MAVTTAIPFVTGNPQIEMQSGTVVVYRRMKPTAQKEPEMDFFGSIDQNDEPCLFDHIPDEVDLAASEPVAPSSQLLAILCIPARFVPTDLIDMLSPYHDYIQSVRLFRHFDDPRQFIALLYIDSEAHAVGIQEAFDGKPFNSLEEVLVVVAFAKCLSFDSDKHDSTEAAYLNDAEKVLAITARLGVLSVASREAVVVTAKSTQELLDPPKAVVKEEGDQCAVCLEHMDGGVLTMACNHSFHLQCLAKWGDSPCPVCRYHHNVSTITSHCQHVDPITGESCAKRNGLLVCVICGYVGCGGRLGHSKQHYEDTLHAYSLEMDSQQVWDFAGDGYVHRLILTKGDGMKLTEATDPNSTYSADDSERNYERRGLSHLSGLAEEEATHRKLEGLAYQYNELLASQLDAQRVHFETELRELRDSQGTVSEGLMGAVTYERRQLHQRMEGLKRRTKRVLDELKIVQACNEQIRDNNISWDRQRRIAEQEAVEVKRATERLVPGLEQKVSSLMRQLDMDNAAVEHEKQMAKEQQREAKAAADALNEEERGADEGEDDWVVGMASGGGSAKKKKHGKKKK